MIKIAVSGSEGRMGKRIIDLAGRDGELEVVSRFDVGTDPEPAIKRCDVLIEFTTPKATIEHVGMAEKAKKAVVIGTTALSDGDVKTIETCSKNIPIVFSPNMSVGVNMLFKLCEDAARILPGGYDVEMSETHHVHKKDAPSGTAKKLAQIVARKRGIEASGIPIESKREGEIVGDHSVTFDSPTETIELRHSAKTRDTFVMGAIAAAKFLKGKKNGLYTMRDVLGIK